MLYRQQGSTDGPFIETDLFGYELLNDPSLNRGTAFTHEERDFFELHGRLPPHVATLDEQGLPAHAGLSAVAEQS